MQSYVQFNRERHSIFIHLDSRPIYTKGEWFREGNEKEREGGNSDGQIMLVRAQFVERVVAVLDRKGLNADGTV